MPQDVFTCRESLGNEQEPLLDDFCRDFIDLSMRVNFINVSDSLRNATDGYTYTRDGWLVTFIQARKFCLWDKSQGELPNVYPNALSYNAVRNILQTTDQIFVDMRRLGDWRNKLFITGLGEQLESHDSCCSFLSSFGHISTSLTLVFTNL